MGVLYSKLSDMISELFGSDTARIVMLGLDAAGKTTILYKVKLNETLATIPTVGFNVETITVGKGVNFTVWDIGSQAKLRPLWRHYLRDATGLVYVVDSNDRERIGEAKEELYRILATDEMRLRNVPFVVIANKQDLPNALTFSKVADSLNLHEIKDHKWKIYGTCAQTGDGIYESLKGMAELVKEHRRGR